MTSQKKRGRPMNFPVEEVQRLLNVHKESVIVEGALAGKKSKIWQDISDYLQSGGENNTRVSPQYLYVAVKTNRYQLLDSLLEPDGSSEGSESTREDDGDQNDGSSSQSQSSDIPQSHTSDEDHSFEEASGLLSFKIKLSRKDWNNIRPEHVTYRDNKCIDKQRKVLRLKRRTWTHTINYYFWKTTKLPCKVSYYGGRVSTSNALHAISIHGRCKFCKSKFYAYVDSLPEDEEGVEFKCSYRGNFSIVHPKGLKRNLSGSVKKEALESVLDKNIAPSAYQRLQADKLMSFGDLEPAHLPTSKQLRDAKSKSTKLSRVDENPIVSLGKAMHESRFKNIIRDVSYDKFQIRYHSSAQIHVYRQFCKDNFPVSVSIDATGSVVKKIQRAPGVKSAHILLYEVVVRDERTKKMYPVCSLLSERQDTETIRHWLSNFLKCNVPIPQEAVTDMSPALMSACTQAFTSLPSLESYIQVCAQLLGVTQNVAGIALPEKPDCYIRNDVAHLVKLMTTWKCIKSSVRITKQFYIRSLCQVLQSNSINEIKTLLKHVITVAVNQTEGLDEDNKETPCEISKRFLIDRIGGLVTSTAEDLEYPRKDESPIQLSKIRKVTSKSMKNPFYTLVLSIKKDVEKEEKVGNRGNQQYLPDLYNHILGISSLIPLWTSVMAPVFGYGAVTASSAPVETEFKILKTQIFRNKTLPMRVDDFVFHHIPAIEGAMKTAATAKIDAPIEVFSDYYNSDEDGQEGFFIKNCNQEHYQTKSLVTRINESKAREDWGGVEAHDRIKSRKHGSYLQSSSEIILSNFTKARASISIGLLKNGNNFLLKPIDVGTDRVVLSNTCAFDSMLQLFATAYCDSESFRALVQESDNEFFKMTNDFINHGISRNTYVQRASILLPLDKDPAFLPQGLRKVSCETAVSALSTFILHSDPAQLEISQCDNEECPQRDRQTNRVPISVSLSNGSELPLLQDILVKEMMIKKSKCYQICGHGNYCQGERTLEKEMPKYLLLEPIEINNKSMLLQCVLKLRDIPVKICVQGKDFHLRGCVGYLGTDSLMEIGHYVAYTLRSDGLWETYNNLKEKKEGSAPYYSIRCHLILYTP